MTITATELKNNLGKYLILAATEDIFHALSSDISDFEDAVMTETAIRSKMDCIITRNKKDYTKAGIPIYDPIEFWNLLKNDDVNDIY